MNFSRKRKAAACLLLMFMRNTSSCDHFFRGVLPIFLGCRSRDSEDMDAMLFEVAIEPAVLNTATADRKTPVQRLKRGPNGRKLSATLNKNLSRCKFDDTGRESPRAHESLRPNEVASLNSHQLSFGPGFDHLSGV